MDIGQIGSAAKTAAWTESSALPSVAINGAKDKISAALTASAVRQPDAATAQSQLDQALQSINKTMQALSPNLEFTVDAESNRTIIKVMDQQTKEIIRQMPSVEAIEISKALDKLQGLLVRQKA